MPCDVQTVQVRDKEPHGVISLHRVLVFFFVPLSCWRQALRSHGIDSKCALIPCFRGAGALRAAKVRGRVAPLTQNIGRTHQMFSPGGELD